ncbi:MAG: TolC family protein [Aquificaceae bacterium]
MRLLFILLSFSLSFALSLEEAINLAIKNNTSIRLSLLDIQKAEENIKKARAGILPQVSFSYSFAQLGGELTPKNRHSYILELDQTVFNLAVFEGTKLAKDQEELQRLIYQDVLREVVFRTKELFYALLYKRQVIRIKEESLRYWEENLKVVEEKYKAGILPKVELLRAKAQLESSRADLESSIADYKKSLEDFKRFIRYEGELEPEGELSLPEYKEQAYDLEKNSTIRVAKKSLEVYERLLKVQKSQYYPSLEAFGTYQGNTVRIGGDNRMLEGYTFGARLSFKVFDGFAREASIAQARIDLLKQVENLKEVEQSQRVELNKVLLDLKSTKTQLKALELSLDSAKEALRLSTERYTFGAATQLEVLDAVNNYNRLLQNYYYLLYLYHTVLARIERLTQ